MLPFIGLYLWCWFIVPTGLFLIRPFKRPIMPMIYKHFLYDIMKIRHNIVYDSEIISQGFILANHRSWIDVHLDAYVGKATVVGRYITILISPIFVLCMYLEKDAILIHRGKDKRDTVFAKCADHIQRYNKRILFYPEGTRNSYPLLGSEDELRKYVKFGLLKSIYQDKQYPVQLQISNNKEKAFNEKKMTVGFGVPINTRISKPIHPKDFSTETEFFNEIIRVWYDCYKTTHV
jgi:1-acyl-sn-glycerol-3-phosphate acyltransferase